MGGYVTMDIRLYRWDSIIKQISDGQVKYGQRGKQERMAIKEAGVATKGLL